MTEAVASARLRLYTIAAHRGFADALVAGLIPRYAEADLGLARLTLLLPSRRTVRAVTEAFVRASGSGGAGGLLLPRMAVVGDLDLDETLGNLFAPLGVDLQVPPAADPTRRWLRLAELLRAEQGEAPLPVRLRLARSLAASMDRLNIEDVANRDLLSEQVTGLVPDLAEHWAQSLRVFLRVRARWQAELAERGEVDPPERRNRLLDHAARAWRDNPPPHPIVAAGVTSAAPAVARLLRTVAGLPQGAVVLPDLDIALDDDVWDSLGATGEGFARDEAVTHPQYHLKLLLERMNVHRGEVRAWHRSGSGAAPPERSRAISNLFLPPTASADWIALPAAHRRLAGVRLMECAHPEEEAQAIAVVIREALEQPTGRVALVTPDRGLASRVVAHLARWNIVADDSAGRPLAQTAAGRLLLGLADARAGRFAPVPVLAVLGHPLTARGEGRAVWLERVRELDLVLRGPRPAPGLAGVSARVAESGKRYPALLRWWGEVAVRLAPLDGRDGAWPLADLLAVLVDTGEALAGEGLWAQADGRALAGLVEQLGTAAAEAETAIPPADLPAVLRAAMDDVAVRPPWGGHPRLAIYGLIEARMQRADLVIAGALHEGSWPAAPAPDPLLAPAVLRALGVPGADFRIGLAAHDLAAVLGAPQVVLSHSRRDAAGPVIPSRFLLRIRAMLGADLLPRHGEERAPRLARAIDHAPPGPPFPRPQPRPTAAQRLVGISATALDRLRGDPYQFYASNILLLSPLDQLDADPDAAIKGTAVHAILEAWHEGGGIAGSLLPLAREHLAAMAAHPFVRATWEPRLMRALAWIEGECARLTAEGRAPMAWERRGTMDFAGVTITGRADRIDRLGDGGLGIIDYKTGQPPTASRVEAGYALQLGVLGLIAERGGFAEVVGTPSRFEYWSLGRSDQSPTGFGYSCEPILDGNKRTGIPRGEFLSQTARYLEEAIATWITGDAPFTARLNPDLDVYGDYDQLMRLDEWQARGDAGEEG
ncbi:MAG: double-strand break repair protein AddB [Novosphingobium sp.]